ncbi:3-oxoacyl-[acyl-carrier-protein] synthase III C-terminal domain-containing protein [Kitasatospora sp. NPDC002227]|uniref:3-oxoacyl-[acyl-carrier-protein] synthase III C-terminal domain-containing protein n=1 Tax=Kitasatospora sp. NPDC002227 TaxID=3154773 RepID=UPI00332B8A78
MFGISEIVTILPEKRVSAAEVAEREDLAATDREILERLGIESVREAEGRPATELATEAARLLADRSAAAFLLVGGRYPELLTASEATRAQRDSGLTDGLAMGVSELGCVSVSAALMVGRGLLAADPALPGVVLAHGNRPPGSRRYRRPVTVNGDGAMALRLARDGALRIVDIALETNGDYWDLFQVDYLGKPFAEWQEACADLRRYSFSLAVESKKRFARMNEELLGRQGLAMEDVDHFVTQNLSLGAFDFYEQSFDISLAAACRSNLRAYGHVGSTDIALNLQTGLAEGEFRTGDLVLVMNNSPVAAWSSMLVEVTGPLRSAVHRS